MSKPVFEAIIMLTNLMDSDGNLNLESRLQADKSAEIYKESFNAKIITCGWDYRKDSK